MAEETLKERKQPYNEEMERSVVGSMMMDKDAIMHAMEILTGEDFYFRRYQVIFDSICELYKSGLDADIMTVQNKLREKDLSPEVSGFDFLRSLVEALPTSANIVSHAKIVREKAVLRRLIKAAEQIAADGYLGKDPLDEILARTEKSIFDIARSGSSGDTVPISQIALEVFQNIEEASRRKSPITGIPTGFRDLDNMTSGLQKSDLILVAARPSMGKTAFVLNIAQNVAVRSDKKRTVAIFSLEMNPDQLVTRLYAMQSGINSTNLRTGNLNPEQWEILAQTAAEVAQSKLIIDATPGISLTELRSKCRKFALENDGLDMIIIDYLQLMSSGRKNGGDNRQQEISDISRGLKSLARELNVPIIALSQLSRAVESRNDKRPMLSDLRESGAIEQDADIVMFLYRDDYYNKENSEKPGVAEVIIAKQRNGPIGTVNLIWLADTTRFVSAIMN